MPDGAAIYWTCPVEADRSTMLGEKDKACIGELLHVHVWPDAVGVNVRSHGNTVSLGKWPVQLNICGSRVTPGPFFEWRLRWAISRLAGQVAAVHRKHAAVESAFLRVAR
jgi:hypothetical protein